MNGLNISNIFQSIKPSENIKGWEKHNEFGNKENEFSNILEAKRKPYEVSKNDKLDNKKNNRIDESTKYNDAPQKREKNNHLVKDINKQNIKNKENYTKENNKSNNDEIDDDQIDTTVAVKYLAEILDELKKIKEITETQQNTDVKLQLEELVNLINVSLNEISKLIDNNKVPIDIDKLKVLLQELDYVINQNNNIDSNIGKINFEELIKEIEKTISDNFLTEVKTGLGRETIQSESDGNITNVENNIAQQRDISKVSNSETSIENTNNTLSNQVTEEYSNKENNEKSKEKPNSQYEGKLVELENANQNKGSIDTSEVTFDNSKISFGQNIIKENTFYVGKDNALNLNKESIMQNINKDDLINQIVDKMKFDIKDKNTEVKIRLKPEILGELTLKVSVEKGIVAVKAMVESYQVKQLLESNLTQLRDNLKEQGINVQAFDVHVGKEQNFNNRGFNQGYNNRGDKLKKISIKNLLKQDIYDEISSNQEGLYSINNEGIDLIV